MNWVVFSYSLPAKLRSSPRVTLWRRLKRLGAVSLAGGVQILPEREDTVEALQWLAQEIRQAHGEALVMHVERIEGLTDRQLIDQFHAARQSEYAEITESAEELEKKLTKPVRPEDRSLHLETLARLQRRQTEIARIDYFDSPDGQRVTARLAKIQQALSQAESPAAKVERARVADYQARHWVTRPHPHVDRLACAWLIRKFIDRQASIRYALHAKPGEVAFDTEDGEFGHRGNRCTFEMMIAAFDLSDPALPAVAEIVHEIDLQDGRYARPEISGIDSILAGWQAAAWSDAEREAQGLALFEGLYVSLTKISADKGRRHTRR